MAFSYNGQPFASPVTPQSLQDSVRFLIQDTDENDVQLQDSEIAGLLTNNVNDVYQCAIEACTILQARYTRKANKTTADLSISFGSIAGQYAELKKSIRVLASRHSTPTPYVGGISQADMEIDHDDDDLVQPNIAIGMDDDQGHGQGFTVVVPGA